MQGDKGGNSKESLAPVAEKAARTNQSHSSEYSVIDIHARAGIGSGGNIFSDKVGCASGTDMMLKYAILSICFTPHVCAFVLVVKVEILHITSQTCALGLSRDMA